MRHVAAFALGLVVALASVLVHRTGPLLLALAVAASVAVAVRLRRGDPPSVAAGYCLGWVLLVGVVVLGRPEGDWAVGGDWAGYAVMGTGLLLVVLGVTSLPGRASGGHT